ncbi:zinc-finger domain-containing protein, partial [Bacillus haynesii]
MNVLDKKEIFKELTHLQDTYCEG